MHETSSAQKDLPRPRPPGANSMRPGVSYAQATNLGNDQGPKTNESLNELMKLANFLQANPLIAQLLNFNVNCFAMPEKINPSSLSMLSWNANGLRDKIIELEDLILERNLDVIFIQETFLKNDPIGIPNYRIFREDRLGRQGGGVAIMIKCNIQHEQIAINHDRTSGSEAVGIKVMTNRGPLRLISIYNPPNNELAIDFLEMIIIESNLPTIVAGDFNAKHTTWSNVSNQWQ
ncbi:hypothetical protein JTB14_036193 [Gonioctena quinquepunctata]|nr:hypothetical protein JTB14_036193 [Gonioctena quinquepunctata]